MTKYNINTKEEYIAFCCSNFNNINEYINSQIDKNFISITNSVDIRESKTKIAPIDNNIYPAGFNNICQLDLEAASQEFRRFIQENYKDIKSVLIYPESNTKNTFYLDHLAFLYKLIQDAGFEVSIGSFDNELFENDKTTTTLLSHSNFSLDIEKISLIDNKAQTSLGSIDLILLNHDQSSPIPVDWSAISTPVIPSPFMGWNTRSKGNHFDYYQKVVSEFSEKFSINPHILMAQHKNVEGVDFTAKEGFEKIAKVVEELSQEIQQQDDAATDTMFFIKASQGTYGMGIMTARTAEEVLSMNKKTRHKMNAGKNRLKFTSVIVQEGIKTILEYESKPAEITIYLVGGHAIGGFMRVNTEKDNISNLNSKGMVFRKFCISELKENRDHQMKEAAYSIVARLSALATCNETKETIFSQSK